MSENDKQKIIKYVVIAILIITMVPALLPFAVIAGIFYFINNQKKKQAGVGYQNNINSTMNPNNIDIKESLKKLRNGAGSMAVLVIALVVLVNAIVIVPAGETGVYSVFGKVRDNEISSGFHLINPLAKVTLMSIRIEQYTMSIAPGEGQVYGDDSIDALTKEGLKVRLDMTVLYRLQEDKASDVFKGIGLAYEDKILRPQVRSAIREVIALYEAKDIYSEKREEAQTKIEEVLKDSLLERGVIIEEVLLRNIALPLMLTQAIETKLAAEQEAQKYDFILQKEEKEAERKRIEATGQRDAQQLINQSLTDRYLQYLYIKEIKDREGTIYVPTDMPLFRGI